MPSPLEFEMNRIDGTPEKLDAHRGQVLLMVNVASACGLTPQYAGLQDLQDNLGDKGFSVLGFPANEFGAQEPGSNDEIASFCSTKFNVTFPMFAKVVVKGDDKCDLYAYLTEQSPFTGDITWNFEKFLVSKQGEVVARFSPKTAPDDPELLAAIDAELAK